jgi:NAD(P)H-flavin reductase
MFINHRFRHTVPAVQRLRASPHLQRAFRQLHVCGPQPVAMFVAELLDEQGIPPQVLDRVLTWCTLDPDVVRALAGDFPPPPLDEVAA